MIVFKHALSTSSLYLPETVLHTKFSIFKGLIDGKKSLRSKLISLSYLRDLEYSRQRDVLRPIHKNITNITTRDITIEVMR